jgi:hypothetical protein
MAYDLFCIKCGGEINAPQYDAYLGLCPECFAEAEDLAEPNEDLKPKALLKGRIPLGFTLPFQGNIIDPTSY